MKSFNIKNIITFLISAVIIFIALMSYNSFKSYKEFSLSKEILADNKLVEELNKTLFLLEQEISNNTTYTSKLTSDESLKDKEKEVDVSINKIKIILSDANNNNILNKNKNILSKLKEIEKNLLFARTKIDTLDLDYDSIYNLYFSKIYQEIENIITIVSNKNEYTDTYMDFIASQKNISATKNYFNYFYNKNQNISENQLKQIEIVYKKSKIPNYQNKIDIKTKQKIDNILNKLEKNGTINVIDIANQLNTHSFDDNYLKIINKDSNDKIELYKDIEKLLLNKNKEIINNDFYGNDEKLKQNIIILTISFLILIILIFGYIKINREKKH